MQIVNKQYGVVIEDAEILKTKAHFGIHLGPKMFTILSDGIYKEKIKAIVRELSTNAYDSHIANGNPDKQFDIHVPTLYNPIFTIRDYGTGMSDEVVHKLYSTYGMSDKDDSNDFTGCLGIGSKSPFCYNTKTFTVESWYNGKHTSYNCFIDKDGFPSLITTFSVDSNEPTGVKISVPVKPGDIQEFHRVCKDVYSVFNTIPKFNVDIGVKKVEYSHKGTFWSVRTNYTDKGARVVMGNIAYPCTVKIDKYDRIRNAPIDIFVDIGDVDITASREELSYDTRTKAFLENSFKGIHSEIIKTIHDEVNSCSSLWEARKKFVSLKTSLKSELAQIIDIPSITWHNIKLFEGLHFGNLHIPVPVDDKHHRVFFFQKFSYNEYMSNRRIKCQRWKVVDNLQFYSGVPTFILADIEPGSIIRCEYYVETNKIDCAYLVKFNNDQEKDEFLKCIGADKLEDVCINASSLPSPTIRKPAAKRGKSANVMVFNCNGRRLSEMWTNKHINIDDGGIYVKWSNKSIDGTKVKGNNVFELGGIVNQLEIKDTIYGVKDKFLKQIVNHPKWVHIDDVIREKAKNNENKIINAYNMSLLNEVLRLSKYHDYELGLLKPHNKDSKLYEIQKKISELSKKYTCVGSLDWYNVYRRVELHYPINFSSKKYDDKEIFKLEQDIKDYCKSNELVKFVSNMYDKRPYMTAIGKYLT